MTRKQVESHYGAYIVGSRLDPETGERGTLVQTDYDFPATARDLGWNMRRVQRPRGYKSAHSPDSWCAVPGCPCGGKRAFERRQNAPTRILKRAPNRGHGCDHRSTDGTIDCADCGVTAGEFIAAAAEYLDGMC